MQIQRGRPGRSGHVHWHQADTQGAVLGCNTSYFTVPTCPCCHEQWTVLIAVLIVNALASRPRWHIVRKYFQIPSLDTAPLCLSFVSQTPCVYPQSTWCHQISQAFSLHICILQVIKDWRWEWPGNEANKYGCVPTTGEAFLLHICTLQVIRDWNGQERGYTSC